MDKRKQIVWYMLLVVASILICACASQQEAPKEKSPAEQEIAGYADDLLAKGKDVAYLTKLFELKERYPTEAQEAITTHFEKLYTSLPKHPLDSFKESPNPDVRVPSGQARLHIKSNYTSGNAIVFIREGSKVLVSEPFPFNTEKQFDLKPGAYEFIILIDRKFNNNKYLYTTPLSMSDGTVYLGEFTIVSELQPDGECAPGRVRDDDTCMKVEFRVFDNCNPGTHLVEYLCCEEGYNFIMDGRCSKYTDKVDTVLCPAGYEEGGQGRCCPKGMKFINGQCQVPPKGWVPPERSADETNR